MCSGTKCDLEEQRLVPIEEGEHLQRSQGTSYTSYVALSFSLSFSLSLSLSLYLSLSLSLSLSISLSLSLSLSLSQVVFTLVVHFVDALFRLEIRFTLFWLLVGVRCTSTSIHYFSDLTILHW